MIPPRQLPRATPDNRSHYDTYIAAFEGRDLEGILALYTDDATLEHFSSYIAGQGSLRHFYQEQFEREQAFELKELKNWSQTDDTFFAEITALINNELVSLHQFFTFKEGRVSRQIDVKNGSSPAPAVTPAPTTETPSLKDPKVAAAIDQILASHQEESTATHGNYTRISLIIASVISVIYYFYSVHAQGSGVAVFTLVNILPCLVLIGIGNPLTWLKNRFSGESTGPTVQAQVLGWIYLIFTIGGSLLLGSQLKDLPTNLNGQTVNQLQQSISGE